MQRTSLSGGLRARQVAGNSVSSRDGKSTRVGQGRDEGWESGHVWAEIGIQQVETVWPRGAMLRDRAGVRKLTTAQPGCGDQSCGDGLLRPEVCIQRSCVVGNRRVGGEGSSRAWGKLPAVPVEGSEASSEGDRRWPGSRLGGEAACSVPDTAGPTWRPGRTTCAWRCGACWLPSPLSHFPEIKGIRASCTLTLKPAGPPNC